MEAQIHKFRLLPWAITVIKKSGTLQEYRSTLLRVGHKGADGFQPMKQVQFFSFAAIVGQGYKTRILVVVRRVGNGQLHFWSVMHDVKPGKNGQRPQLMPVGREEE